MRKFEGLEQALDFVVKSAIPNEQSFLLNVVAPSKRVAGPEVILQFVDQNWVYQDGEFGLTLHLAFDVMCGEQNTHELFTSFDDFAAFDYVPYEGIPCYAIKCNTDIPFATRLVTKLLLDIFEYPDNTPYEYEVDE